MIDDEKLDELTTAVAPATHAAAEANVIRQQGVETFLIGAGVCLALIGAGFFIAAKKYAVEAPGKDAANREAPAAMTKAEREFVSRPEFEAAEFKGRLAADPDGLIRFDNGTAFVPAKYDPATGHMTQDHNVVYNVARFIGDFAFCNSIPASENLLTCYAIDHDAIVDLDTTQSERAK